MASQKFSYRPDIDGLRAVAVISVIINHLSSSMLPGGFLGVDIFFVISGFVITGSLLEQNQSRFSTFYLHFFSRRVKRILPALTACFLIVSLLALALDPFPEESIDTGIASLFGVANIVLFNLDLDYFAASSKFNAFTHTWSLGVEEQFYVMFPVVVWFCFFSTRVQQGSVRTLAWVLAGLSLLSVSSFFWLYEANQPAAYFLTPMRIWELSIGAMAFLCIKHSPYFQRKPGGSVPSNIILIALLACFFIPATYADWATLTAVVLTGLLLMGSQQTVAAKILARSPTVYVGKISYSLYLWHWPLIVLLPYVDNPVLKTTTFTVLAMFALAIASYHLLETPLRRAHWSDSKGVNLLLGLGVSVLCSALILFAQDIVNSARKAVDVRRYPPSFLPLRPSNLPFSPHCVVDAINRPMTPDTFRLCTIAPKPGSGGQTIWAMGDSHAGHLQGLLYELHDTIGVGVHLIETPGIPFPLVSKFPPRTALFEQTLGQLKAGDIVLLGRLYMKRDEYGKTMDKLSLWTENVSKLADQLSELKVNLIIMGPPPMFMFEDIRSCDLTEMSGCTVDRAQHLQYLEPVHQSLENLTQHHENLFWFNTFATACPPTDTHCWPTQDGIFLFRDKDHFNTYGAKRLNKPFVNFLRNNGALTH